MLPPGPDQAPAIQMLRWFYRPIAFLEDCRRRYGEAFSVSFVGFKSPMVLFSDPAAVKAVYSDQRNGLPPGRNVALEPMLGSRSVLLLEGREHLTRRRLMLPAFHGERMRTYEAIVRDAITREIDRWPVGEPFPLHPRMQAMALEVILRAVFGVTSEERLARLRSTLGQILGRTASPVAQLVALAAMRLGERGPWARFEQMLRSADDELYAEIAERREDPRLEGREDILSMLVSARFEEGGGMSDAELRDQLMTLLLAGHETTATALAWAFDLLLHNPAELERLREELDGGDEAYLRATVAEALRLRPVVPIAGRRLAEPLEIDGYDLPAGTDVTPAIWLTHTRPDVYEEPLRFRPERFLGDGPETYAWIPFGGGVRRCLGAAFAEFEMRIVLAEVAGRCRLEAAGGPERVGRRNVTLSPRDGTRVRLLGRDPVRTPAAA
ncbi:MAG TPA: cytochrome P450 [Solirubrobacterales bacterium]|nr:cytochrome P450 [Solirubrobacterales bacterium]